MKNEDYFLDDQNCVNRLIEEYKTHGKLIIAYDYDNTVFDYYGRGDSFIKVIELLRECKKEGFHLTVFTSCNDDRLFELEKYLLDNEIPFDGINDTPEYIPFKGRKVYYNILLDDRAGLSSAYNTLWKVIYHIRGNRNTENITDVV